MIDKTRFMLLKKESKLLLPVVRIGKRGITDNMITEITQLLKKRKLIKIKILTNSLQNFSPDKIVEQVVAKCDCVLIDRIGLTFSVYRGRA